MSQELHDLVENLLEGGDDVAVVFLHLDLVLVSGRVVQLHTQQQDKTKMSNQNHALVPWSVVTSKSKSSWRGREVDAYAGDAVEELGVEPAELGALARGPRLDDGVEVLL